MSVVSLAAEFHSGGHSLSTLCAHRPWFLHRSLRPASACCPLPPSLLQTCSPRAVLSDTSSRVEVLNASLVAAGNSKNRGCWLPVPGVGHGRAGSVPCPVSYLCYLLLGSCFSCVTKGTAGEGDGVGDARVVPGPLRVGGGLSSQPGGSVLLRSSTLPGCLVKESLP